jgi:hypothetical protein
MVTSCDVVGYKNKDKFIKEQKFQGPFVNTEKLEVLSVKR